jgi:hypothetical protein
VSSNELSSVPGRSRERIEALAQAVIDRLARFVRPLPSISRSDSERRVLRSLAAWYEKVRTDDHYVNPPPAEGIETLFSLALGGDSASNPAAIALRAIRVAVALSSFRRPPASVVHGRRTRDIARSRLELAIASAADPRGRLG